MLRASGIEGYAAHAQMLASCLLLARGEHARADELAAAVVARFTALGTRISALEASLVRVEATLALGRPEDALAILDAAEDSARGEGGSLAPRCLRLRAMAEMALARPEARITVERGLAAARSQGLPYEEAELLLVRAALAADGDPSAAGADRARATRILAALGAGDPRD